jgi:hypothetical protein
VSNHSAVAEMYAFNNMDKFIFVDSNNVPLSVRNRDYFPVIAQAPPFYGIACDEF